MQILQKKRKNLARVFCRKCNECKDEWDDLAKMIKDRKVRMYEIEKWIKKVTADFDTITLIGSGGNINKLFKLSEKHQDSPLSYEYLNAQYQKLNSMTYEQRIAEMEEAISIQNYRSSSA